MMRLHPHGSRPFLLVLGVAARRGVEGQRAWEEPGRVGADPRLWQRQIEESDSRICPKGAATHPALCLEAECDQDRREEEPWTPSGTHRETQAGDQTPALVLLPRRQACVQIAIGVAACRTVCGGQLGKFTHTMPGHRPSCPCKPGLGCTVPRGPFTCWPSSSRI